MVAISRAVHIAYVIEHFPGVPRYEQVIRWARFGDEIKKKYLDFIRGTLAPRYAEFIGNEIHKAYLESYTHYSKNMFDRYLDYMTRAELYRFHRETGRSSCSMKCSRGDAAPTTP